jgi:hypothetical protein
MVKLIKIVPSKKALKKYDAHFDIGDGKVKVVSFGAIKENGEAYSDFTKHHDEARKERYIERHSRNESFTNPMTPATLARFILWNKTTLSASIADYKRRFNV